MTISADLSYEATSRTARARGLTLHFHEAGPADAPALVLLHGGGPGASAWSSFGASLPALAPHFRTLLVDMPCFGRSDKPELDRGFFSYAADAVAALMDELGLDEAHFAGASLGGGTAARVALDHPDKVDRLLLISPAGLSLNLFTAEPTEGVRRLLEFGGAPEPTREQTRAFLTALVHDPALVTDALVEERLARATDPEARLGGARLGAAFAAFPQDSAVWPEAARLTRPTLLVWGREDRVNPLDGALLALKAVPDARLHVFPRCGHLVQTERADELHRLAVDFFTH